jgi:hypothetical protein
MKRVDVSSTFGRSKRLVQNKRDYAPASISLVATHRHNLGDDERDRPEMLALEISTR